MVRISQAILLVTALLLSVTVTPKCVAGPNRQGSTAAQEDKTKACNDLADKKGRKGSERNDFVQNCINKGTNAKPPSEMSQKEKMDACKSLADKKNLSAQDRKTFLKDFMNKANPK